MSGATTTADAEAFNPEGSDVLQKLIKPWMDVCDALRVWERQEILLKDPNETTLAQYRDTLKWMLRLTRILDAQVRDPEFPAGRRFISEVEGRLIQLQNSWEALNNPLTQAEADNLIFRHFADEPRS